MKDFLPGIPVAKVLPLSREVKVVWTKSQRWCLTLGAVAGLWTAAENRVLAQAPTPISTQVSTLESSVFQDILQKDVLTVPVSLRSMQDPNALRPNEGTQMTPLPATPGSQVARNLLGIPQRNEMLARRGRLRNVAMSQNRAAPMIGDLFGGGTTTLTVAPKIGDVIPYVSPPGNGPNFNSFATFNGPNTPISPFYAGTPTGNVFPLLTSFGQDTNNDGLQDTYSGLQQYAFNSGVGDPNSVVNPGPFTAVIDSGRTVVDQFGNTVPLLSLQQQVALAGVPNPGSGGVVGVTKIAENTSPMPRDRFFFNYSHFSDVPFTPDGMNVNRFTPGFEKTFNDGTSSIEFRAPFATTLNSNITTAGITDGEQTEFGNASIIYKTLLYRSDTWAFSGGLQTALPTADPVQLTLPDGTPIVKIKNQSVHLMPFVGALYTPDDRLFSQAYFQVDVAANGNDVSTNLDLTKLRQLGTVQDNTFLYLDWSLGYWSYLAEDQSAFLTGIAPMVELHFNQSVQNQDVLLGPNNFRLGVLNRNISVLNAVIGTSFQFGSQSALTAGYAFPIGSGVDQQFDGEFRLFYNRRFGPQTRQIRAL